MNCNYAREKSSQLSLIWAVLPPAYRLDLSWDGDQPPINRSRQESPPVGGRIPPAQVAGDEHTELVYIYQSLTGIQRVSGHVSLRFSVGHRKIKNGEYLRAS